MTESITAYHTRKLIQEHNRELQRKEEKKMALKFLNMRMRQLQPAAFIKNLPKQQQNRQDQTVERYIKDQQNQLIRRKGKPPNGLWMYV